MNPQNLAAVASVTENETYVGNRLQFKAQIDPNLTGHVSGRLVALLFLRAGFLTLATGIVVTLIEVVAGVGSDPYSGASIAQFFVPIAGLSLLAFLITMLIPVNDGLSEWEILLDGKAASAETAYAAIFGTLRSRQIPVAVTPRRFRTVSDSAVNNFLVVGQKPTYVYLSVFAYGTSLYVGWQMWRRRLPFQLLARWVADAVGSIVGRDRFFMGQLASNKVRALREAVHSAAREGVDAVNYGLDIPLAGTFGYDPQVEMLGASTVSGPVAPQPPVAPYAAPVPVATGVMPTPPVPPVAPVPPVPPTPPVAPVPTIPTQGAPR